MLKTDVLHNIFVETVIQKNRYRIVQLVCKKIVIVQFACKKIVIVQFACNKIGIVSVREKKKTVSELASLRAIKSVSELASLHVKESVSEIQFYHYRMDVYIHFQHTFMFKQLEK